MSLSAGVEMKTRKLICALLTLVGAVGLTVAVAYGQILPVGAGLVPRTGSPVTVSILQNGVDVTSTWLPEPGVPVTIRVNGPTSGPITLVCPDGRDGPPCGSFTFAAGTNPFLNKALNPPIARTSAYPGICTNSGLPTDVAYDAPDFIFDPTTNILTPTDCGGMAVIRVPTSTTTSELFILPQDDNANGIPEIWERVFCPGNTCPTGAEDADAGPGAGLPNGDGLSAFDEYRGFMVSRVHVRTDPRQRDVFVHLVNASNPGVATAQCGAGSLLGGGPLMYPTPTPPGVTITPSAASGTSATFTASGGGPPFTTAHIGGEIAAGTGRARIVSVLNATTVVANVTAPFANTASIPSWPLSKSLSANLQTLVPAIAIHVLGYTPGGTNLFTDEWVDKFSSLTPPQTLNVTDDVSDRVVNPNRLYGTPQKGIRIIECLDTNAPSVLGWAYGVGSPNSVGNVIVFTQRIVNYITGLINPSPSIVKYSTFSGGVWTPPTLVLGTGDPASVDVKNFVISKAIQFYLGMEAGHSLDLTPLIMTSGKNVFGHHFAPGTGDCLDQTATNKDKSGVNTFYIPSSCGGTDQSEF